MEDERIFVSIPSYRDPGSVQILIYHAPWIFSLRKCQFTISDLLRKATNPISITVGVCFQYHFEEDIETCFQEWPEALFEDQIRIDRVDCKLATGPCWARFRAQQLWKGEPYYLSIDSHTRFIEGWDSHLIKLLKECPSEKPIITTYPVGYERGKQVPSDPRSTLTCALKFGEDGMLRLNGRLMSNTQKVPIPSLFWVSGFSFSKSNVIQEVPYDPHLKHIFFGEESSMVARLWTNGFDFFAPGYNIVWHLWSRSYRPVFRENKIDENQQKISMTRIKLMLRMLEDAVDSKVVEDASLEMNQYGLGIQRSLEEYQIFSGVDFKNQEIEEKAKNGGANVTIFNDHSLSLLASLISSSSSPKVDQQK